MSAGRVRAAVLVPGVDWVPEWVRLAVSELQSVPDTDILVVVVQPEAPRTLLARLTRAFDTVDGWLFPPSHPARRPVPLERLASARIQPAQSTSEAWAIVSRASAAATLDVVIDLTEASARPRGFISARLGVWAVMHDGAGAESAARDAVVHCRPAIRSVLARIDEEPAVLYESVTATDHVSPSRTADRLYWKAIPFAARALRSVRRDSAALSGTALRWSPATKEPSSRWMASLPAHFARYVALRLSLLRRPQVWTLLVGRGDGLHAIQGLRHLAPARGTFWADPFIVERDGKVYLFFEELPYATGKGHISVVTLDDGGQASAPRIVLERPYHLSYPFLFEFEGQLFLLPETGANRTVELYRCESFPDRWVPHSTLMRDVHAVDSTLLEHEGRWWLFTNIAAFKGSNSYDELCLFHAPAPDATVWTPHPLNPVVSHAGFARPAGSIVRRDGLLIRPSQDCTGSYGRAVRLNRIDRLTDTEYHESPIATIEPNWDPNIVATHTISTLGDLVVLDGKLRGTPGHRSQPHEFPTVHPVPFSSLGSSW